MQRLSVSPFILNLCYHKDLIMKVLLFIAIVIYINATPLRMYHDYDRATNFALLEHKKVILIVFKKNCKWCIRLKNGINTNAKLIKYINKHYILAFVNNDLDDFPLRFHVKKPPAIFIINPNLKVEDEMILGYVKSQRLLELLKIR